MSRVRLPRVDLAKLTSDDPGRRRPMIDQLGDALCRFGAVRLLGDAEDEAPPDPSLGELVLETLERYFGLAAGTLRQRVSTPAEGSGSLEVEVLRLVPPLGGGGEVELPGRDGEEVAWSPRPREILVLAGRGLERWTAGVIPASGVVPAVSGVVLGCPAGDAAGALTAFGAGSWDGVERPASPEAPVR